jgi:NAD-dependent SIR2 family protein deacetylase
MTEAYCVKCRKKIKIEDEKKVKLKNGKPATKGKCPKCGTGVFRIGG